VSKAAAFILACAWANPLGAMGLRPSPVSARIQVAAADWRGANMDGCAAILEPLAWSDPAAAREWAAFLFLQQRYGDVESFFASTPSASLRDDEARLWLARAQLNLSHYQAASVTLQSLSNSARPMALALAAEAASGQGAAWGDAWPAALKATKDTHWDACTALAGAEAAQAAGQDDEAEILYKRAEKADQAYSMIHARLARLYAKQGRIADERIRLERALRVDPDDKDLRQNLDDLLKQHASIKQALDQAEQEKVERFLGRVNPEVSSPELLKGEPLVRVGLLDEAPRFRLKLGGTYLVEAQGRTLPAESTWEVHLASGGGWQMRPLSHPLEAPVFFSDVLRLKPLQAGSTFGLYDVDHGAGYFWATKEDRYYRGVAELRPQKARGITLVNELGLEAYLLSVVPSEAVPTWPMAALEAQAIAARTEAWRSLGHFGAKGYDLCPTVLCAVYAGVGAEHKRSSAAVTNTAGLVLEAPSGRLHPTFYMHHSGGHTQEPGEAWSEEGNAPRMAVVDAPAGAKVRALFPLSPAGLLHYLDDLDGDIDVWARDSSSFRWTLRFSAAEADQWVERRHDISPLKAVLPLERSPSGYVRRVCFVGQDGDSSIGSSDRIRTALKGLKSNLFYAEARMDLDGHLKALLLHGGGWGHGVGMAQVGAKAQADAGSSAPQILQSYFPASHLTRRYPAP
jgi:stage II sporulation protein D